MALTVKQIADLVNELTAIAAECGGTVYEEDLNWQGPFDKPPTFRIYMPSGAFLDAMALRYRLHANPAEFHKGIIAETVRTAEYAHQHGIW